MQEGGHYARGVRPNISKADKFEKLSVSEVGEKDFSLQIRENEDGKPVRWPRGWNANARDGDGAR